MATYRKRKNSWQVIVRRKGISVSATFSTKAEAINWATQEEAGIISGTKGRIKSATFGELLKEYAEKVSPTKKGERWEIIRILLLCKDPIANVKLADLSPSDFAQWRDKRLKTVGHGSVRREWNLLSSAINIAIKEWGWLTNNPLKEIKRPAAPASRDRLISDREIELLLYTLGYGPKLQTISSRVGAAMLFAIETGMRASEITNLKWDDLAGPVAIINKGKTLASVRRVPLSKEALRILGKLPKESDYCFNLNTKQMDSLFRKAKGKSLIEDLHFHDTRHLAVTRLAQKLDILDLARMIGHRDLKQLQIYYNQTAEEIAKKLD